MKKLYDSPSLILIHIGADAIMNGSADILYAQNFDEGDWVIFGTSQFGTT